MATLSSAIITDDLDKIEYQKKQLSFSDQLVLVVDGKGKDSDGIYFHPLNSDFAAQRNYALGKSVGDWVLFVDDDEVVSSKLAAEIRQGIERNYEGYYLRRLDSYYGQTLYHGETGKIRILRLAKRAAGRFVRPVHEFWKVNGRVGILNNPLFHIRENLTSGFIDRIMLYGPIDANALTSEGKPFSVLRLLFFPLAKFTQNYILRLGILDGLLGLFHAYLMSVQSLSVRIYQWEKTK